MTAGGERLKANNTASVGFLLTGRLTLLTLLVNTRHFPIALSAVALLTIALYFHEHRARSPIPWFALAAVLTVSMAPSWWRLENHEIASICWLFALGFSRLADRPIDVMRMGARAILVVIFGLAFAWKLLSSQYMSNDFFRYTMAWDERFAPVSELVGGADQQDLEEARRELRALTVEPAPTGVVVLPEGPRTQAIASLFTAGGVLLEGAAAMLYALPLGRRTRWLRPASVLTFCVATYIAIPVVGFGLLLLTLANAETESPQMRRFCAISAVTLMVWGFFFPNVLL